MSESTPNWTFTGIAGLIGIAIGNLIGSSDGGQDAVKDAIAGVESRVVALGEMSADIAGLGSKIDTVGAASSGVGEQVAALMAELEAVKSQVGALEGAVTSVSGQVEEQGAFVGAFGQSLGMIGEKLNDMRSEMEGMMVAQPAGGGAAEAEVAAVAPAAEPEPEPAPSAADLLAEELGEGGLILSVGQTGVVDEIRVFLSKIADGDVLVSVEGARLPVGQHAGSLTLENGCTLTLLGVADRKAFIQPTCE